MRQGAGIVAGGGGPSPTVRRRRWRSQPPPHEADDRRGTADEYEGRFGEDVVDRRGANSPHTESLSQSSGDGLSIGRPCTRSVVLDRCYVPYGIPARDDSSHTAAGQRRTRTG